MPYSTVPDLLVGNIPLPTTLNPTKFVQDASDEIDSKIGLIYTTPIDITDTVENPVVRPVRLLLKRLNNFLASGRLILTTDAAGEETRLHAYGASLINEAQIALEEIVQKKIVLDGVPLVPDNPSVVTTPLVSNVDSESNVEAFYDRVINPDYLYLGGLIR